MPAVRGSFNHDCSTATSAAAHRNIAAVSEGPVLRWWHIAQESLNSYSKSMNIAQVALGEEKIERRVTETISSNWALRKKSKESSNRQLCWRKEGMRNGGGERCMSRLGAERKNVSSCAWTERIWCHGWENEKVEQVDQGRWYRGTYWGRCHRKLNKW